MLLTTLIVLGIGVTGIVAFYAFNLFRNRSSMPETAAEPQRPPVRWPEIELSGMAGTTTVEGSGSAILNGTLIAVNQRIERATLVRVEEDGVILEYKGDQKFIRIGETTE